MRRLFIWASAISGVLFAAFAGLFFFDPFAAGIVIAEVTGVGYGHPRYPPALAGDANVSSMQRNDQAEQNWNAIVIQRFPKGSSVQDLLTTLRGQGFTISPGGHASYQWDGMPCLFTVDVIWSEDTEQRISAINGGARSGCL
jgi:hypothetical protein